MPQPRPITDNPRHSFANAIIRAALRDAAIAPTVFDALDITGDALRRLSEMSLVQAGSEE